MEGGLDCIFNLNFVVVGFYFCFFWIWNVMSLCIWNFGMFFLFGIENEWFFIN